MDIKDVEKLSELAKIELSAEEKEDILKDMGGILEYVKVIEKVELEEVAPNYDIKTVWREDKIEPREFSAELITGQFPDSQPARSHDNSGAGGGVFLKVKKIM